MSDFTTEEVISLKLMVSERRSSQSEFVKTSKLLWDAANGLATAQQSDPRQGWGHLICQLRERSEYLRQQEQW